MTTATVADQLRLLDVQALDTRLQQLEHQRKTLPGHTRVAEVAAQRADVERAVVESRTAVVDLRRELTKAEADVEQVRTRAVRDQARMDSGSASVKDVQALVAELETLGRRTAALEEVELDVMVRLEAHETALAGVMSAHEALLDAQREADAQLAEGLAQVDAEVATVTAGRAAQVEGIDADLVALYDRLRGQLGGLGVARLRGRTCEGCRLELNPGDVAQLNAAAPEQVVRCEECDRILVRVAAK